MKNLIFILITLIGSTSYSQDTLDYMYTPKPKGSMLFSGDTVTQYSKTLIGKLNKSTNPLYFYILINSESGVINIYDFNELKNILIINKHKRIKDGYVYHCENNTSKVKIKIKYNGILTLTYTKRDKNSIKIRELVCVGMSPEDFLPIMGDN